MRKMKFVMSAASSCEHWQHAAVNYFFGCLCMTQ